MRIVNMVAKVNIEKCKGCGTCEKVCPCFAITLKNHKPQIDEQSCRGCGACEQRCPYYAIEMKELKEPFIVKVDIRQFDYDEISKLCQNAKLNPQQIICYCTGTRAEEVAA
ncbi:4Fe-4S binding protein, partial [Candidatus Aerophobetes bacterium]|nr:4Fe-4S binding protein [Candidatus Aerophobetes bacterium]